MKCSGPVLKQEDLSHLLDHFHFALAGILTCLYLALEVGGSIAYTGLRRGPFWEMAAPAVFAILLSIGWSIRMGFKGRLEAFLYLIGDIVYLAVVLGLIVLCLR